MPAGEIQLVAYGDENIVLNDKPQITFFKIIYRRYTNFSIETVKNNFLRSFYRFTITLMILLSSLLYTLII